MEYKNLLKLERAKAEAIKTGEDVRIVYLRLGGLIVEDNAENVVETTLKKRKKSR